MSTNNTSNRIDTEVDMMKEMIEVMKSYKESSKSMTLDEALWLVLFIFVLFNKIYNYYFKDRCTHNNSSNSNNDNNEMNKDPSQCELI